MLFPIYGTNNKDAWEAQIGAGEVVNSAIHSSMLEFRLFRAFLPK